MKRKGAILLLLVLSTVFIFGAPRIKIVNSYLTPYLQSQNPVFAQDSSIAQGINTVAKGTYVYLRAWNYGDTGTITSANWTFISKPAGSGAALTTITGLSWWAKFKADSTGTYDIQVSCVTTSGSKDTTIKIYAATYVGTGNFDNIPAVYPNCMTCHGSTPMFQDIFNRWKTTLHATTMKRYVDGGSASFGINCFKCHTVGYDHNLVVNNNGFDDKARELGWIWSNYSPPKPGNWDTIRTRFAPLVAFASVGCESCHGPGSEHVLGGGDTNKIQRSVNEGVCGKCHDSPTHHNNFRKWSNALHSHTIYSSSFAQQNNGSNDLQNCIRCHDGQGYVNFTKGIGTNTNNYNVSKQEFITCATCHNPHGSSIEHQIRERQPGVDTLANGYHYTNVGTGIVCMDCHKSRADVRTYINTRVTNSRWGPHHGPQTDLYEGQIAATFGGPPYRKTLHYQFLTDACVTCHMAEDTTAANKLKVGGHSVNMHNDSTDYDNVNGCRSCHFGKNKFEDWIADQDYDGNNQIEAWETEIEGCLTNLRIQLPPVGVDSVSWQLIAADSFNVTLRKAYWNYQVITEDKSMGMHNVKYAVDMLIASKNALIGIIPISNEIPVRFEMSQNYPNPFNPTTNINFSIPKQGNVLIKIYDITGREVKTLINEKMNPGKYKVDWNSDNNYGKIVSSGVYFYRITAGGYTDTKKMILVR